MRLSVRGLLSLASTAVLVAACAPATTVGSAGASVAPSPSVDLAHPVGIIAIGHSGLTGEGTGGTYEPVQANSWATGTDAQVDSVYLRMVAALPQTEGHVANTAAGGAPASTLSSQAQDALTDVPAPALAIIQTVDNDIQCDASNVADVGESVADVLTLIHGASPHTKILVVGQLGRPSVTFVKALVAHDPTTKNGLATADECTFFDARGALHPAGFEKLTRAIDAYEAETARVCAAVPGCVTDAGVRRAWVDRINLFSPDYAHLNKKGQAAEATLIWPVVQRLLAG